MNDKFVYIHFDGWSDNFNYWEYINHLDFRPVGWAEYKKQKIKNNNWNFEDSYKNIKFDPPKGSIN